MRSEKLVFHLLIQDLHKIVLKLLAFAKVHKKRVQAVWKLRLGI